MSRIFFKSAGNWFLLDSLGTKIRWEGSVIPLESTLCDWLDIPGIPYNKNKKSIDEKKLPVLFANILFDKLGRIIKISPTLLRLLIIVLHRKRKVLYHPSVVFPTYERTLLSSSHSHLKYWPFKPVKAPKGTCTSSLHTEKKVSVLKNINRNQICSACEQMEKEINYALWPTRERIRNCLFYNFGQEIDEWFGQHNYEKSLLYLMCKELSSKDIMEMELYTQELDLTIASWPSENIFKQTLAKRFMKKAPDFEYLFNFIKRSEFINMRQIEELGYSIETGQKIKIKKDCKYFDRICIGDTSYVFLKSLVDIFKFLEQKKYTLVMSSPDYYNKTWIGPLQLMNIEDVRKALSSGQYDTIYGNITMCKEGHVIHKALPKRGRIMSLLKCHPNVHLRDIGVEHTSPYLKHQQAIEAEIQMPWNLETLDNNFILYLNKIVAKKK